MTPSPAHRAKSRATQLSKSLGFVPGVMVAIFGILGIVLVEIDKQLELDGVAWVFAGDGPAARTVLSVIAGSLITVAGLTFSITMVVLQLASTQFSPRILRTFFGDRITQVTIGAYVGTFVYAIFVLRAVGSFGDAGFVPRLSVTVAALLGIAAVVLLIVYLHHVSQMVQVSHVTAEIARETLRRIDALMPDRYDPATDERDGRVPAAWRDGPSTPVFPARPGYVQRVDLDGLTDRVEKCADRVAILVCPGDFAGLESPIAAVWPASAECTQQLLDAVSIADERDLEQDVDFGIRQLADTALRAASPGVNDPMTVVTCVSYLRSILVRITERATPAAHLADASCEIVVRRRDYGEYLGALRQVGRHARGDAWVTDELFETLRACVAVAARAGAVERVGTLLAAAQALAERAHRDADDEHDRDRVAAQMDTITREAAGTSRP